MLEWDVEFLVKSLQQYQGCCRPGDSSESEPTVVGNEVSMPFGIYKHQDFRLVRMCLRVCVDDGYRKYGATL
jgi:hypothetical protein